MERNYSETVQRYFILNKPYGYLSQFIYKGKGRKKRLDDLFEFPPGIMAIGRLDEDSEGLLLLTTDGKLSNHINSIHVEKEYFVQVDGEIDDSSINRLRAGVEIGIKGEKYKTRPCKVTKLPPLFDLPVEYRKVRDHRHGRTSWLSIVLNEGKYRQIRKMTSSVGFPTLRLIRVRIGNIHLNIEPGKVIEVGSFF